MIDTAQPTIDPQVEPPARTPVGHSGIRVDVDEHPAWAVSGFLALLGALATLGVTIWQIIRIVDAVRDGSSLTTPITIAVVAFVVTLLLAAPMVVIAPGETRCS